MAIFLPRIIQAKRVLKRSISNGCSTSTSIDIPKGYFAVYVGEEEKRRFVVPISLLSQPAFQELLHLAEEEFGYNHSMGGLTIPCSEDIFSDIASRYARCLHIILLRYRHSQWQFCQKVHNQEMSPLTGAISGKLYTTLEAIDVETSPLTMVISTELASHIDVTIATCDFLED
ncbi:hypothetical protein E3N88_08596 [Mikania micrantha]|uniref:Uncharacterized protein n=1 Tax=Mikania micrantha TaxID=192012 RepID=A0A5N6PGN0_9ASTR|nr:hypothetical protein E3N88_08596 [Mikania micrantha]